MKENKSLKEVYKEITKILKEEVRPIKLPLYVYKRINGQEYCCGYGHLYRENVKHKKEPIPAKEIDSSRKHYLK